MDALYTVLLYYCYTPIDNPEIFRAQHHHYCLTQNLKGRIIIASEGINGTISGLKENCDHYIQTLQKEPRFSKTKFKIATYTQHAFQKLHVRVKKEIVHANLSHIDPNKKTGKHLTVPAFEKMKKETDVILLDVRSNYEHQLGKFKDAVTLDIDNFRDFAQKVDTLAPFKKKKIITYCTGGIKCEKASAYLLAHGFENVYQLHGGIIQYGLETDGKDFEGKCYVFDNRIATDINQKEKIIISTCYVCQVSCDRMINCANPRCNQHVALCHSCAETLSGACSPLCQKHPAKRPYDGTGYYAKQMNGYDPYKGSKR